MHRIFLTVAEVVPPARDHSNEGAASRNCEANLRPRKHCRRLERSDGPDAEKGNTSQTRIRAAWFAGTLVAPTSTGCLASSGFVLPPELGSKHGFSVMGPSSWFGPLLGGQKNESLKLRKSFKKHGTNEYDFWRLRMETFLATTDKEYPSASSGSKGTILKSGHLYKALSFNSAGSAVDLARCGLEKLETIGVRTRATLKQQQDLGLARSSFDEQAE